MGLSWRSFHAALIERRRGEKVFKRCKACHKIGEGAKNSTGPALTTIYGRTGGTAEGYRYSDALTAAGEKGLVWNESTLAEWLKGPSAFLRRYLGDDSVRSKMGLKLKKDEDIANIIEYLKSFSTESARSAVSEAADAGTHDDVTPIRGPGMRVEESSTHPHPGDPDYIVSESGTAEDLAFMKKVIAKMEELNLMGGPNAIRVPVYPGLRPHGVILGTLFTQAEIDGRTGELIVKRSYEHPDAATDVNRALADVQANPDDYIANYAVMFRRESGYQDPHHNWFYAEFEPNKDVIVYEGITLAGRVDLCVSCHALAEGDDYFFTTNGIE